MEKTVIKFGIHKTWQYKVVLFLLGLRLKKIAHRLFSNSVMIKLYSEGRIEDIYLNTMYND